MSSDAFDTYLLFGNSEDEMIGENNNYGTNSELIRGLPQTGTYTIWASSASHSPVVRGVI